MSTQYKNIFWIGVNLLFELKTGKMTDVLQLVYREQDASTFTDQLGDNVLSFVSSRTDNLAGLKIRWSLERSKARPELFVIRGEQDV
jgi:hypothetical protein